MVVERGCTSSRGEGMRRKSVNGRKLCVCVLYGLSCSVFLLIIFLAVSSAVLAGMKLVFFLPIFQSFDPFPFTKVKETYPLPVL